MKKLILLALVLLVSLNVSAIEVLRDIQPAAPKTGAVITITISILNDGSQQASFILEEALPSGITLVEPAKPYETKQRDGITLSLLKWNILASPGRVASVSYKLKPTKPGQLTFQPVKIIDTATGAIITGESNELTVFCSPDRNCDKAENYLNCPQDCSTGASDGICNPIQDLICDLDCTKGADSDCKSLSADWTFLYYILGGVILLALIIFIVFKFLKSRPEEALIQQQPQQPQQEEPDPLAGFDNKDI